MQDGDKKENEAAAQPKDTTIAPQAAPPTNWQYTADGAQPADNAPSNDRPVGSVSWTASEYIAHDKTPGWFSMLGVAAVLLAALVYLLTRDVISVVVIVIFAVVFGVFAARKPRVLKYVLDQNGLYVADKFYPYQDFKSFSVMDEGGINGISLSPLKRFMPGLTIYYAPKDEDDIVQLLGSYLPLENRQHDMVDRLMRKVRF